MQQLVTEFVGQQIVNMGVRIGDIDIRKFPLVDKVMPTKIDVRNETIVYLVFRRDGNAKYYFQGVACATQEASAEEIAISMCRDETYFIFPSLVNVALPHKVQQAKGLYFPLRDDNTSNSYNILDTAAISR